MTPDTDQPFTLNQMAVPPRRRTGLIVGVAAGTLALIAATIGGTVLVMRSGSKPSVTAGQASAPSSATPTAAVTTAAAATTAAPAPTAAKTYKFGEKATNSARENSTAIAYGYKQPVAKNATRPDQEGFEWAAVDVEVCPTTTNVVTHDAWRLVYADHTTIDPSNIGYQQFPEPAYPWDEREVAGGQCIRGWITYPAPVGKRPAFVEYGPQGFIADWTVS